MTFVLIHLTPLFLLLFSFLIILALICRYEAKAIQKIVKVMEDKVIRTILKGPQPVDDSYSQVDRINLWVEETSNYSTNPGDFTL